ncbi:hypothetical protein Aoki45_32480 [Algoriphagus sp. oki45]|uniref:hypothetical protein n=1 Tax=Algoriphagus sp. oki45 TaxID=3067294 RepID=UPI0027FA09DE|nr:hypothetical protein Aoki45_32480 [Algoriphagus sp. oki45]
MRILLPILTAILFACSPKDEREGLFGHLTEKESVEIYLSSYNLDSIPSDIGQLKKAKSLYITKDSTGQWEVYPPESTIQEMTDDPPFRYIPEELTELTQLQNLGLVGLDLAKLPTDFDRLQHLDTLNLMMNKLNISDELDKLKKLENLKYLVVFGNNVDSADIAELKRANPKLEIIGGLK